MWPRRPHPRAGRALALAVATVLLLLATSAAVVAAQQQPSQEALDAQCRGLDRVQIPHPTDCGDFLVCCAGTSAMYECLKQRDNDKTPYPRYGTAQRVSYYNAFKGACERFDETGAAPGAVCGVFNKNAGPISTPWALQVCTAKEAYEEILSSSANETLAKVAATIAVGAETSKRAAVAAVRALARGPLAAAAAAKLLATPAGAERLLRRLLQAPGNNVGMYQQIINPDLGRSSTGSLGIHAAMIPTTTKVLLWGRQQPSYEPGMTTDGTPEVSSVYDYGTGTYVKAPMRIAPFCSGHSHLSDGTIVAGGGDWANGGFLLEGRYAVRTWAKDGTAWTVMPEGLAYPHWYPTQAQLPDDRTLILGGYASEADPGVPAVEIWDGRVKRVTTIYPEPFLQQLGGLNLYPTTLVLPWTNAAGNVLFLVFACNQGRIMSLDPSNNLNTVYALPAWPTPQWCSAFSALGSALLLRMDAEEGFRPELAMFGGSGGDAGNCACDLPANDNAYRLPVDQGAVTGGTWGWAVEKMPGGRNMVDSVLLPNGKVLLVNGAKYGNSNGGGPYGGSQARDPEYNAWLYDPHAPAGSRFTVMAASPIKRLYHSTALLMPDGNVLVMGSEQDECVSTCFRMSNYLYGFQAERFMLPYSFLPLSAGRPSITGLSATAAAMGGTLTATYTGTVTHAVLAAAGAVTHQTNMNQRVIKLATTTNGGGSITVRMPPAGGLVAPAGWYMLFLMNADLPCQQASWVRLTAAPTPAPAPGRAAPGALLLSTSTTFEAGTPQPFSGGAYNWAAATLNFAAGGGAAFSGAVGAAVTVTTPGTASWHVQVFGPYIPLSPAKRYTAHFQIRASATTRVTVTWLREGDYVPFGTTSFQVDAVFKDYRVYALTPPAAGNYHLQFEMGLAPAGTVFYLDDIQVFDLTLPPSANPMPPVNGDPGGGTTTPPPPPPTGTGTLIAAASDDFTAAPFKYGLAQFAGGAATVSFATGAAVATVTAPGTAQWHLQLVGASYVPLSAAGSCTARVTASASAAVSVNVLWLREGTFAILGLQTFAIGPNAKVLDLAAVTPPTDGAYHLQIEFGLAPAGTTLTFDNIEAYNGAAPAGGGTPPPPPPPTGTGTLIAAASDDFTTAPFKYGLAQFAGGAATVSFATGAAVATVTTPGTAQWHLQLVGASYVPLSAAGTCTARVTASASAAVSVNVLWLREGTFAILGLQTFAIGPTAKVLELAAVSPPTDGAYHLQIEFGLAPAGTTLTFDNIEAYNGNPPATGGGGSPPPPPPPPPTGSNVLAATSENFNGPAAPNFSIAQFSGAAATVSFTTGAARISVVTPGTESWYLQLKGPSIALEAANTYTITLTASASAPASIVLLWLQENPIAPIGPQAFAVGTTPVTLTLPAVRPLASGAHHVQIEFGKAPAGLVLTIDNIVVTVN